MQLRKGSMAESDSMAHSSPATTFGTLPSLVKTEDPDLVSGPLPLVWLMIDEGCDSWDRRAR
jgi:hypothetical protein